MTHWNTRVQNSSFAQFMHSLIRGTDMCDISVVLMGDARVRSRCLGNGKMSGHLDHHISLYKAMLTANSSLLLICRPRKDERLSWPSWLTCSGWLTHISGHPSAAGRAQDRESSPLCHATMCMWQVLFAYRRKQTARLTCSISLRVLDGVRDIGTCAWDVSILRRSADFVAELSQRVGRRE